jgi:hypothetical protein
MLTGTAVQYSFQFSSVSEFLFCSLFQFSVFYQIVQSIFRVSVSEFCGASLVLIVHHLAQVSFCELSFYATFGHTYGYHSV